MARVRVVGLKRGVRQVAVVQTEGTIPSRGPGALRRREQKIARSAGGVNAGGKDQGNIATLRESAAQLSCTVKPSASRRSA